MDVKILSSVESLTIKAENAVIALFEQSIPIALAVSHGKDSSVCLSIVLNAARRFTLAGNVTPPLLITHGDTGVENPEMSSHAKVETKKALAFADKHGFGLRAVVAKPSLSSSWAYRTMGAGKLPSFPGANRDCSEEYKVKPQNRLKKKVMKELSAGLAKDLKPVTVIGTRFEESDGRRARMESRGETAEAPWEGADKSLYLSPIAHWEMGDVWEYLGECKAGRIECYSDCDDIFRLYADATSSSCAVVADMALGQAAKSKACGARTGCFICTASSNDRSLESMLDNDERYAYMRGLNKLQRFLIATRFDWDRRNWLARTINDLGYSKSQPDVYSPKMVEELLRYTLTLDAIEEEESARLGIEPRFEIVSQSALIAIDAEWSRLGYFRPFHALRIYDDIMMQGERYDVPEIDVVPRTPIPPARYIYVGLDWDEGVQREFTGLRNPLYESFEGCPISDTVTLSSGKQVMDMRTDKLFDVDEEAAGWLLFDYEYNKKFYDDRHDSDFHSVTSGYQHYLALGTLTLSKGAVGKCDEIIRRTAWREREGLTGPDVDYSVLYEKGITQGKMKSLLADHEAGIVSRDEVADEASSEDEHLSVTSKKDLPNKRKPRQATLDLGS